MGLARECGALRTIREVLDTPEGRACCRKLARDVAEALEDYLENGYAVEAVLGGDVGSPGCAVIHLPGRAGAGQELSGKSGVFMLELLAELNSRVIDIPFRGMRDSSPETLREDLAWLQARLDASP